MVHHDPCEWEVSGGGTENTVYVDIIYKKRGWQRSFFEFDLTKVGIRVVDVGPAGYRLYDVEQGRFISWTDALDRIADALRQEIFSLFGNDHFWVEWTGSFDGTRRGGGRIDMHGEMEPLSIEKIIERMEKGEW